MKIHVLSDLHLEFAPYERDLPDADVLVLAGDVTSVGILQTNNRARNTSLFVREAARKYQKILWVMGNHEHYHSQMENTVRNLKAFVKETTSNSSRFFITDRGTKVVGETAFVMATLWTDYFFQSQTTMDACGAALADHRVIYRKKELFTPLNALEINSRDRKFILDKIDISRGLTEKVVVVTHHAPSLKSIHPRYQNPRDWHVNGAFCQYFEESMQGVDVWFHGHTHDPFDYMVGKCRVVCNPRGYPGEKTHDTSGTVIEV